MNNKEIRNLISKKLFEKQSNGVLKKGEKIKIDKNILESLLFEKKFENGKEIKYIAWSVNLFPLSNIDLSEISFDNVSFDCKRAFEEGIIEDCANLSYTNAKIDFSKSPSNVISNVFFEGLDLSNSNIKCIKQISDSILSKTNLELSDFNSVYAKNVFMDNLNLGDGRLNCRKDGDIFSLTDVKNIFINTSMFNSKANLTIDNNKDVLNCLQKLSLTDNANDFAGCIINGKNFDDDLFNSILYVDDDISKIKNLK